MATVVALIWPAPATQRFDGLPLNTPWEFIALLICLTYLHRPSRWRLTRFLRRGGSLGALLYGVLAGSALALKLLTAALASPSAFVACYTSLVPGSSDSKCERSFDAPFAPQDVTRYDQVIDFRPHTWRLGFFNDVRFNYMPVPGALARDRLPFAAEWRGTLLFEEEVTVSVEYVGEGQVRIGTTTHELPPSYRTPRNIAVRVPAGRYELLTRFRFDDGFRIGQSETGPLPSLRVTVLGSSGGPLGPLRPAPSSRYGRLLAWASEASIVAAVSLLAACLLAGVGVPALWVLGLGVLVALAVTLDRGSSGTPDAPRAGDLVFDLLVLSVPSLLLVPRSRRVPLAWMGLGALCTAKAFLSVPSWQWTAIRSAGNDWLTYESQARTILGTWSLEGGEPVFFYQPLYRYVRFLERIVFGEAEAFVMAIGLLALSFGVVLLWLRCTRVAALPACALPTAALWGVLALVWSPEILVFLVEGASEYPTWIALPFVFWLVAAPVATGRRALAAVGLLALSVISRPNMLPPAVLLSGAILAHAHQRVRRGTVLLAGSLLFCGILLLPALHNLYYGGRLVLMTTSATIPENLVLPPEKFWSAGSDASVRAELRDQIARALYLVPGQGHDARFLFRLCQLTWLGAVVLTASRARRDRLLRRSVVVVPWLYLAPHLFLQTHVYYPRHIVAGHMAFALSAMWIGSRGAASTAVGSPRRPPPTATQGCAGPTEAPLISGS